MSSHRMSEYLADSEDAGGSEPASPMAQYMNNSVLSISVLAVLEFEVPLDDLESQVFPLLRDIFLPISPRFSSIMITGSNGIWKWKRVHVTLEDHFHIVEMSPSSSPSENSEFLRDYLTRLALAPFPKNRPLWEIHAIRYPTTEATATLIFKLHHSLGDGYSLMGALLSCLQRADDPSLPLTFPYVDKPKSSSGTKCKLKSLGVVPKMFSLMLNTMRDFSVSLLKSTCLEDDLSPIHSGDDGVEFRPFVSATTGFSMEAIKQVKSRLHVTINDIICGMVFLGIRLYMQKQYCSEPTGDCARTTALVLLNTRSLRAYKTVQEMAQPACKSPWGNRFSFLHVSVPKLTDSTAVNPLKFVYLAHKLIKRKRSSLAVYLTGHLLHLVRKLRGPETLNEVMDHLDQQVKIGEIPLQAAARYMHNSIKNTSISITNLMGPNEQMALCQHPIKGLYSMTVGVPQSLAVSIVTYNGRARIGIAAEKGFIDSQKLALCIDDAFMMISQATFISPAISSDNN